MLLSDIFRICKIYADLGGSVQEQINDVVTAHEDYPNDDEAFENVLSEQNYNAVDYGIEALKEMADILKENDPDMLLEIDDLITRTEKITNQ